MQKNPTKKIQIKSRKRKRCEGLTCVVKKEKKKKKRGRRGYQI